jgi:hypothetical protein
MISEGSVLAQSQVALTFARPAVPQPPGATGASAIGYSAIEISHRLGQGSELSKRKTENTSALLFRSIDISRDYFIGRKCHL